MKQALTFLALVVLAAGSIWFSLSDRFPVKQGLDLQGGMRVTLEPDATKEEGRNVDRETMEKVRSVIENRVNSFGLSGAEVRLKGDQQILVLLPGAKNPQEALAHISKVAQLEFRHLNNVVTDQNPGRPFRLDVIPGNAAKGEPDQYNFYDVATGEKIPEEQEYERVIADTPLIVKGDSLKPTSTAEIQPTSGQPIVTFEFDATGRQAFGSFTTDNVGEILAVVLDQQVITAPYIREPITEGQGTISGGFRNMAEAKVLSNLLNSGALPVPLRPAETQYVGATLGQESVDRSIQAGVAGLALVLVFMLGYYWLPGLLACIALVIYAGLTFSIFKGLGIFPPIVLDLPGITGFILSVGMAVDANILIFERLKEELRAGKPMRSAIDAGFSRAFSAILDSNVTTWIVTAVLIWLGAPMIKGFAITLAIGVAVSMFTAITVTRSMLYLLTSLEWARNPALYALNVSWLGMLFPASRQGAVLSVFRHRKIYLGISALLGIVSLAFVAMTPFGKGLQPGIDFTGGTVIEAAYRNNVSRDEVRNVLRTAGVEEATVSIGRSEQPWTSVRIEGTNADATTGTRVQEILANVRGFDPESFKTETTGETFTAEAVFTNEVSQEELTQALRPLNLKGQKVAVNPIPHQGDNAVPVALITTRQLTPPELDQVKSELEKIGGGIVEPMYQSNSIGPSVAREVTLNAFWSVLVASLGIVLYLAFRFAIGGLKNGLKFGAGAIVALVHDVGIVVGLFALMGAVAGWQIDSLFVTAALTILAFSVHDTIVVYDRVRENLHFRRKGETFADVSDTAITQTFDRSVNTSVTILLVIAALVLFGGASIRLFNLALFIGVAIGTYSSIFVAAPLVVMMERAAAGRAEAAPAAPARREKPEPAPRPKREPVAAATRPSAPAVVEGDGAGREEARPSGGGSKSGTIRPKKKRRL